MPGIALTNLFKSIPVMAAGLAMALLAAPAVAGADPDAAKAPTAPMREQVLTVPGDPARPVELQATLFEPPGPGPFPLAIMNHGAKGAPRSVSRYRVSFSIDYLLSRGYAVVAPMMRGFAGSGGEAVTDGCDDARIGQLNAKDILGVIGAMKARPDIDASRVLVMGQSFGGWNSLGLTTLAAPEVKGVINFVGGVRMGDCDRQDAAMLEGFAQFGRESRIPSLWFYGERDALFPERIWRAGYKRFTAAGGKAELVDFGAMEDAHNFLGHGEWLNLWVPKIDAWLAKRGLPHRAIHPEFMPAPRPRKTNYAAVDDIASVPFLGRAHPEFYRKFLDRTERPRAIVVGPRVCSSQSGGFDPVARAMAECAKQPGPCLLYAYDDDVVWTGPAPGQTARIDGVLIFGKAAKQGAPAVIQKIVALSPGCAPRPLPALAIAQAPAHGEVKIESAEDFPDFSPPSPFAACDARKAPMLHVRYTAKSGFAGVDFFAVTVTEAAKPPRTIKYAVHVN